MEEFNQLITLITNIAVVGGLIFLAVEVRHNTNLAKTQIHTELTTLGHETHNWKRDLQFAEILVRAEEDYSSLTDAEKLQFSTYVFQILNLWEHALGSYRRGMMSKSYWDAWNATFPPLLLNEAWLSVWKDVKPNMVEEFQQHVDSYIDE